MAKNEKKRGFVGHVDNLWVKLGNEFDPRSNPLNISEAKDCGQCG